jgi:hypothetical protein
MTTLTPVTVPLASTCPKCGGGDVRLEAIGAVVDLVHDGCVKDSTHRAYVGPVSGLRPESPLALELALAVR